jgi:hypothetical protein
VNEAMPPNEPDVQPGGPADGGGGPDHIDPKPDGRDAANKVAEAPALVFSPERFDREFLVDAVLRHGVVVVAVLAFMGLVVFDQAGTTAGLAVVMLLVIGWIAVSTISAGVWRALPGVTVLIGRDPGAAEAVLAGLMKRRPVMRWVRLMLYHRLAAIRHRQHRFAESAAICRAVLSRPLGPARRQRGSLLLMLAEASLQSRDPHGAYTALAELHGVPLGLAERLQRLTIQTRYEVLMGHDRAAMNGIRDKLLMAELMPAEHCGAMHAMLTASAKRTGKDELADWLWRRSELLCGREQLDRLVRGAFAIGVVGPPE